MNFFYPKSVKCLKNVLYLRRRRW